MKTGVIEQIKDRITIPDYLQRVHGITVKGTRCKSFRPDAKNPSSLLVNPRDWYDFGSGLGGDIIDLAAYDQFNGDKGKAIRYLASEWGLRDISDAPQIDVVFRSYLGIIDEASRFYQGQLKTEHVNYLHGRGLTDHTISELRIGWAENPCAYLRGKGYTQEQIADSGVLQFVNRMMIPYLRNGKAVYMLGRASVWESMPSSNPEAKYTKLFRNEVSEHPIWGFDTLRRPGTVIIAEGIFDAISCWQENFPVVTAVTGAFSSEQKKDLFPALKGREVIVCMDYDPETHAGQKFTATLADELFEHGIHVSACFLKGEGQKVDLSQLYAMNPSRKTLDKAFTEAVKWENHIIAQCAKIPNENERQEKLVIFLRKCARILDWATIAQLISDASETQAFPPVWLKEIAKALKLPPKEIDIVNDYKKKFSTLHHESLGFYDYNGSAWERKTDGEVRQRIADLCGKTPTARLVDGVFKLLKPAIGYIGLFDQQQNLINFPNGMLDIETGKLQSHDRDFYSSIQMNYCFDPAADCPNWRIFMDDITNGDEIRQTVIQEMFGYCLTKDVRYQKCFYLLGSGANGKSVLLNILEAMVNSRNASHVEVSQLGENFQRIKLMSSMVNICGDIKTDVRGTENYFKNVVAGDPITGCYKGRDFVDFKPFCKVVFSANRMLTTRDIDFGFLRRICFIHFPVTFTDNPKTADEKPKDANILERLLPELPGIFNWALQGLRILREDGHFPESAEQLTMMHDLHLLNDPLLSFTEDVLKPNEDTQWKMFRSRKYMYDAYKQWCIDTNTTMMSARSFWPRLRQHVQLVEKRVPDGFHVAIRPKNA